jgi:hypothetical protein
MQPWPSLASLNPQACCSMWEWNDFRKAQGGAEATTEPTPSVAPSPPRAQPPKATVARPSPAPVATGNAVFPSTVSPKYSGESAGKGHERKLAWTSTAQ